MLIQDLVVILDEMMSQILAAKGQKAGTYPQSKVEKLAVGLNPKYLWSAQGCYELIAARNVYAHGKGRWTKKSLGIVRSFISPPPSEGSELILGTPMLFYYRKAMRTFLSEVSGS